ncbi:hypothetical protein NEOLEDRAFT_1143236 [Neolentinus lepideus HHB14362 ss-1]|uniref:Uncharacterized protein n=1 Tax=Neolentinus lepideus HHB14362 ss-1 TaxID=1314782 RepID=A0A165MNH5_9AGAM|nr:hypothetical protein NEOLEDRAFT_1143236 [Neolentinus lepideus HHB14362 ss-1]
MPFIADMSIVELRSLPTEGLGPGSRITIENKDYEYFNSDDDDSIDNASGPGKTFYKLIKRISAPIEIFISYCSDLVGNGPDALYAGLMAQDCGYRRYSRYNRKHVGLYHWAGRLPWSMISFRRRDYRPARGLIDFVIDRRYAFSVR